MIDCKGFLCGVLEGYYGRPWSWQRRFEYADHLARLGLDSYIYAPKADPYLRKSWQCHWPADQWHALRELARTCAVSGLCFGVGLSPFALYADYGARQQQLLRDKIDRLNELEAPLLALLFDDMPGEQTDLAGRQAHIVQDVAARSHAQRLLVCPTYYSFDPVLERHFGRKPDNYWQDLGRELPAQVDVFWTGNRVCADTVSRQDLLQAREALGRPVVLWDNYPVNDGAVRSEHLYFAPLTGRERAGPELLAGHFCNPMLQALCSLPALAGLAALHADGSAEAGPDLLSELLGGGTWQAMQQFSALFRDRGLGRMTGQQRRSALNVFRALPDPAAAEIVRWLQGEDCFDPACLTD
ncbi:beta-N-acetylglucosaminidase domain-containing protein [Kineobactrum salinum]|uniref:Hyaluronidase n=1 Tax=Kineobactrum salinum TaxID=2708301 RepID=A0A6C0U642_9GAMM|nr:beta-N-acetylglucosaminidase domain-containing protein [Kineobactrum salinum]QIB67418.1 hyaluronidase [Kineobactrum salinum]